jgi:nicotinamide mononucleotide transporter
MNSVFLWLTQHYFELIAAILGFIGIFFQIKQNPWYWLISIFMVSMYIFVYIDAKLYADMSLQVYYLIMCFYGWYNWVFGRSTSRREALKVSRLKKRYYLIITTLGIILFVFISQVLIFFTDSDLPYWDSFTTSLSFIATWMLAKKILENWLLWIIVNVCSVGIYIHKDLLPTSLLFVVLAILAVVGYNTWKKDITNTYENN